LHQALGNGLLPFEVNKIKDRLKHFNDLSGKLDERIVIDRCDYALVKRILVFQKRNIHEEQEKLHSKTPDKYLHEGIASLADTVNELLSDSAMNNITALEIPPLTDYLTLKVAYDVLRPWLRPLPDPKFDEKFGILQAPGSFLIYLDHFRTEGWLRNTTVSVAYVDIDNFKHFNTQYTETVVDQRVLPPVMHALEAHVFSHGYAFRFGGDEYVLLMPNMSNADAISFLSGLQCKLRALKIDGVTETISVSIGLCTVDAHSSATNLEIQACANYAKNHAKEGGKNCIATFHENDLTAERPFIIVGKEVKVASAKAPIV
jgi:diguanylate cyclase (GGDEF)-like protein